MADQFSAAFFRANRAKLQQQLGDGLIALTAHGVLQRSSDTTHSFAQERNFWYLTGVNEPDVILVMEEREAYLIVPPSDPTHEVFNGSLDHDSLSQISGIDVIQTYDIGWRRLRASLRKTRLVHTIVPGPLYEPHHRFYVNPARRRFYHALQRASGAATTFRDIRAELSKLRAVKQDVELEAIRRAVDITVETIESLRGAATLETMQTEYVLEAAISEGFRRRGAAGHAYTPIVASGMHATTLHYVANNGAMIPGDLVVLDVGAEVGNYAADISRTVSHKPVSDRQAAVYDAVRQVQSTAQTLLRPGTLLREYEQQVCTLIGEQLVMLGLVSDSTDHSAVRRYYPHAASHFLGLDVHDAGDYNLPLEAGMVLTCEPGIYIPEEGIGVRIEDDLLITKNGVENLSRNCSYEPYVI